MTDANAAADRPSQGAVLVDQMGEAGKKRERSRDIRPLARLWPFLMKHKVSAGLASVFLIVSTGASLGLTVTARGAIDRGFADGGANLTGWFLLLGANAVLLALATASRYFYVTRTGERMIADLRQACSRGC